MSSSAVTDSSYTASGFGWAALRRRNIRRSSYSALLQGVQDLDTGLDTSLDAIRTPSGPLLDICLDILARLFEIATICYRRSCWQRR